MIYAQPRIRPGKWDAQTNLGFWNTNGSPNLEQATRASDSQKKKERICRIVDIVVPADHKVKLKESEKRDKSQDLARELKKRWNMKVMVTLNEIGAFVTVPKGLIKELEDLEMRGPVETIQTTALLRSARILSRVLESWWDLLSLRLQWKTICKHLCEKLSKESSNYSYYK